MALTPTRRASSLKQVSPSTPVYQTTQANSSQFGGLEAKANVGAAGSAARDAQVTERAATQLAQANAALGQSIYTGASKIFDVVHQKTLDDEKREVQQQMNRFSEGSRGILSSLNQLSGEEYVNASAQARDDLADLRQEISATSTTQRSQGNFLGMSGVKAGSIYDSMSQNFVKHKKIASVNTNNDTIKLIEQQSSAPEVWTDPEEIVERFTTGYDAARSTDKIEGRLSPESRQVTVNEIGNKVVGNAIRGALARGDIRTATAIFNGTGEYEGIPTLTGKIRTDIAKLVKAGDDADKIANTSIAIISKSLSNGKADLPEAKKELRERLKDGRINGTQYKEIMGNLRAAFIDSQRNITSQTLQSFMDGIRASELRLTDTQKIANNDEWIKKARVATKNNPAAQGQLLQLLKNKRAEDVLRRKVKDEAVKAEVFRRVSAGEDLHKVFSTMPGSSEVLSRNPEFVKMIGGLRAQIGKDANEDARYRLHAPVGKESREAYLMYVTMNSKDPSQLARINPGQIAHNLTVEDYPKVEKMIKIAADRERRLTEGSMSTKFLNDKISHIIGTGDSTRKGKTIANTIYGTGRGSATLEAQLRGDVATWYTQETNRLGKPPADKDVDRYVQARAMNTYLAVDLENTGWGIGPLKSVGEDDEVETVGLGAIVNLQSQRARDKASVAYDKIAPGFIRNITRYMQTLPVEPGKKRRVLTKSEFSNLAGAEVVRNWTVSGIKRLERQIEELVLRGATSTKPGARADNREKRIRLEAEVKEWEKEEKRHEDRIDKIVDLGLTPGAERRERVNKLRGRN